MFYIDSTESPLMANDRNGITIKNKVNPAMPYNDPFKEGYKNISYLLGVTLEMYPEEVKSALREMNFEIENKRDAVEAMAYLATTKQFKTFLDKIKNEITQATYSFVSPSDISETISGNTESNWSADNTTALITGIGTIVGGVAGAYASDQQKKAAEEMARAQMTQGALEAARLKQELELERQRQETARLSGGKTPKWVVPVIVVSVLLVIGVIVTIVILKKKKG